MTSSRGEDLSFRIRAELQRFRDELLAAHRWTHLETDVRVDAGGHRLTVRGEVAVDRLREAVQGRLAQLVPTGWVVDAGQVRPLAGGAWHEPPMPASLWASHPDADAQRRLATELLPGDGPVQLLARLEGTAVVRLRDGTVGWIDTALGPSVPPRPLPPPYGDRSDAVVAAARGRLGCPYALGGASDTGIDCSALVQRALLEAAGVLVPRHSKDQLGLSPHLGRGAGRPGDLVFVWTRGEARCHVGIATGSTMVHASLSRRIVVEDDLDAVTRSAKRAMHVPFACLLEHGRAVSGADSLTHAGVRLGVFEPAATTPGGAEPRRTSG